MQLKTNITNKSSRKISLKRILIAVLLILLGFSTFLVFDSYLENLDCYCDVNPVWIKSGEDFIFIRWYLNKGKMADYMELWVAHKDGTGARPLYRFDKRFLLYGIRFFYVSDDSRFFIARLSKEDVTSEYLLRDFIYIISLDGSREPEIWELKKGSKWDIILDYRDDIVLERRVIEGKENRLVFTDIHSKRIYSEFVFPIDQIFSSAVLYDKGRKALVIIEDLTLKNNQYEMIIFNRESKKKEKSRKIDQYLIPPHYLPKKKIFISATSVQSKYFYVIDEKLLSIKKILDPTYTSEENGMLFDFSITPDESCILTSRKRSLFKIHIDTGNSEHIQYPVEIIPTICQNPGKDKYIFSNGRKIFVSDLTGNNLEGVTKLAALYDAEQNPLIRKYLHFKEYYIWKFGKENH